MLKQAVRRWVDRGLRARGYELREVDSPARGYSACLRYATSRGLSPRTVFDVGVGRGTSWLYAAFPDAKLVLFEPLSIFEPELRRWIGDYGAELHRVALGKQPGSAEFNLNSGHPTSSSLLSMDPEFKKFAADVQGRHVFEREIVEVETLDRLNGYEPPFLIKLDVEGAELQVLEGATRTLRQTEFLIAEISVMRRQTQEPSFAEIIAFLDEHEFELFDIPMLAQVSGNGQLLYLDAAFVRKGSSLWPR